jgi:4-amino-4-deoxy-L-arabinose transferase-like glycosyltransferase
VAAASVVHGRWGAVGLACLAGVLLSIRLDEPGWFDNEGRFAEAAREMIVRHDWITPRINLIPYLTKPPLTSWLVGLVFLVTGPSEWARLVPLVSALVTIVLTCWLGARLYGARTGLVAGLMLATMLGFVLEARTLRPDCLVILAVTATIWCWYVSETSAPARRTRWLVAMYAALGVGMLVKGFVAPVLAAVPIGLATVREHGLRGGVTRLRPLLGLGVIAAIVLPWHVAAALANPGFAWDYIVNQHLLFALDKKEPRDSEGDTLAFFWQMFAGRASPWVLLAPFTLREAIAPTGDAAAGRSTLLLWTWVVGVLGLFSLTPSRLEHYSLPALPAVALLAARAWQRAREDGVGSGLRGCTIALGLALAAGGVFGVWRGEALAASAYWMPQAPGLMALVAPASQVACWAGLVFVGAGLARNATAIVAAAVAGITPFLAILIHALIAAEALFSWRPVARALERVPPATEIVFQAPVEYQIVGGLDFYLGRAVTMLEPAGGFTPPTYLQGYTKDMFITRDELDRRWASGRPLAIVSDPQQRRDAPDGLVPAPFHVLERFGDRWVLTNFPLASAH